MELLKEERKILLKDIEKENLQKLSVYEKCGGYQSLALALKKKPEEITEEVKKSGLRGRGGAGFPTGMKWGFVPKDKKKPVYLLCNADESEPGTFKDRVIIEKNPHMLIEGIVIASYAVGSEKAYIYIRGEYAEGARILERAVSEAYERGYLGKKICGKNFNLELVVHRGAGAYICGEETGLISSLEGKKGYPKLKPPFPAISGFLGCPSVVNNVETLANIPWIVANGGQAYASYGTEKSTGTRLFCVSGWVNKPGVYEEEMGTSFSEFLEKRAGGMKDGAKLKAVIPGGSSTPPLTPMEVTEATLDYESMGNFGSFSGSGGIIVIPEHICLLSVLERLSEFYWDESCGQCTPCREGTGWLYKMVKAIEEGKADESVLADLKVTTENMMGRTICALADAAAMPIVGFMKKFPEEFEKHFEMKRCPYGVS